MKMFVVQKMPDPRDAGYQKALEHWIAHFVEKTDGRAFVLFTSYRDMQHVAGAMEKFFIDERHEPSRAGWRSAAQQIA